MKESESKYRICVNYDVDRCLDLGGHNNSGVNVPALYFKAGF